jgi:hypothetical protein
MAEEVELVMIDASATRPAGPLGTLNRHIVFDEQTQFLISSVLAGGPSLEV